VAVRDHREAAQPPIRSKAAESVMRGVAPGLGIINASAKHQETYDQKDCQDDQPEVDPTSEHPR